MKYFGKNEFKETISAQQKFDSGAETEKRTHTYESGAIYTGEWKGGFRHGHGTMQWTDTAKYEGFWEFGVAQGQGTFTHPNKDVYEGTWYNNKTHGKGVYTNNKGARYEGHFKED